MHRDRPSPRILRVEAGGFLTAPAADGLAVRFGRWVLPAGALLMAGGFGWVGYAVDHARIVRARSAREPVRLRAMVSRQLLGA
ncbi:hypothetical protein ACFXPS_03090 [Nocardia sp. NPDC059091]|uniref:hypothetical protein n=1 Tax=unclassified Nocardia TaxID=2637762 RepID=UPI00369A1236